MGQQIDHPVGYYWLSSWLRKYLFFQYIDHKNVGGLNPCIGYWNPSFCENLGQSHDRCCGQWIAITCVIHNCLYYTHAFVFTCYSHLEVYFSSDNFEKSDMGGACSAYGRDEGRTHGFGWKKN